MFDRGVSAPERDGPARLFDAAAGGIGRPGLDVDSTMRSVRTRICVRADVTCNSGVVVVSAIDCVVFSDLDGGRPAKVRQTCGLLLTVGKDQR